MISEEKVLGRFPDWARVLIVGGALWCLTLVISWATGQTLLIPSVIIIGSFTVPVSFLVWVQGHRVVPNQPSALTMGVIIRGFIVAGCVGVLLSSLLEVYLVADHPDFLFLGVAVIEETIKLAVLWILATRLEFYTRRDGMVLGVAVGLGFGAFETSGYVFNLVWTTQSVDFGKIIATELVRGFLSPFGHGLWTGLLGGALFAAAHNNRLRLTWSVIAWWCVVVITHAFWDVANSVGILAAALIYSNPASSTEVLTGQLNSNAPPGVLVVMSVVSWAVLIVVALASVLMFRSMWKRAAQLPISPSVLT